LKTQLTVFLAGLAGWMNRKQQDVINYLQAENEILKEQLDKKGGKLDLSNTQRRKLAKKGKKLGWKGLMLYASIVTPDTILSWHRKLVALKYTGKRRIKTDRQKEMGVTPAASAAEKQIPISNALAAEKSGHGSPKRLPCPKFDAYDLVTTLNPSSNCDHLHLSTRPSSSTSLRLWPA